MTDQEKIQEEIRLLNLKVDELKSQNSHYSVESEELEAKKKKFLSEMKRIESEHSRLLEVEKEDLKRVALLEKSLSDFDKQLNEIREKVTREEEKLALARAENIREEAKRDELKYHLSELDNKIRISQNELSVKFDSLKGFEEQLLIKEALLGKREQALDLKEQGVKM